MKPLSQFFTLCLALFSFFACTEAPKSTSTEKADAQSDSIAITSVIHNFYQWYDDFQRNGTTDYVDSNGKVSKLDMAKVTAYHGALLKSGFISQAYVDGDLAYLKKYEAEWQKNDENGNESPLSGLDYDRLFCGQDWEISAFTTAPVKMNGLGANQVKAAIESSTSKLELVKENGKWLIAKISCE